MRAARPGWGKASLPSTPAAMAPDFVPRIERMRSAMTVQGGVRIPGDRRHANRRRAMETGVTLTEAEVATLADLAGRPLRAMPGG